MSTFSIITPTLQRDSLFRCCESLNSQTLSDWHHIIVVDGGPLRAGLFDAIIDAQPGHANRTIVHLGKRCNNFGNTPRSIGWKLSQGDYCIYLDDDNYFASDEALADIHSSLLAAHHPHWAVFPILRFGRHFFSADPGCCHVDTANMVIRRDIAQWPNRDEYTLDGIFCEQLKTKYPFATFPDAKPIIVVPTQSRGE